MVDNLVIGFTRFVEQIVDEYQRSANRSFKELIEKLRSILRSAVEEVAYGNLIDFVLFHYAKAGRKCVEALPRYINFEALASGSSIDASTISKLFDDCEGADEVAHGLVLFIVVEFLKTRARMPTTLSLSLIDILTNLRNLDDIIDIVQNAIAEFIARLKRIAEAYEEAL